MSLASAKASCGLQSVLFSRTLIPQVNILMYLLCLTKALADVTGNNVTWCLLDSRVRGHSVVITPMPKRQLRGPVCPLFH